MFEDLRNNEDIKPELYIWTVIRISILLSMKYKHVWPPNQHNLPKPQCSLQNKQKTISFYTQFKTFCYLTIRWFLSIFHDPSRIITYIPSLCTMYISSWRTIYIPIWENIYIPCRCKNYIFLVGTLFMFIV